MEFPVVYMNPSLAPVIAHSCVLKSFSVAIVSLLRFLLGTDRSPIGVLRWMAWIELKLCSYTAAEEQLNA